MSLYPLQLRIASALPIICVPMMYRHGCPSYRSTIDAMHRDEVPSVVGGERWVMPQPVNSIPIASRNRKPTFRDRLTPRPMGHGAGSDQAATPASAAAAALPRLAFGGGASASASRGLARANTSTSPNVPTTNSTV